MHTCCIVSNLLLGSISTQIPSSLVDQPPGTGFSYTSTGSFLSELDQVRARSRYPMHIVTYLRQMAAHVNAFLKNFYAVFPEMQIVDVRHAKRFDIVEMTNFSVRLTSRERVLRVNISLTLVSKVSYVLSFPSRPASRRHPQDDSYFDAAERHCNRQWLV